MRAEGQASTFSPVGLAHSAHDSFTVSAPRGLPATPQWCDEGWAHLQLPQQEMCPSLLTEQGEQRVPGCTRGILRGVWRVQFPAHSGTPIPLFPGWPSVPYTLLHCGADKLADQRQELFRVPGMKLLQQGEEPQHQRRPVHGVGGLSADHSCEDR